MPARQHRLILGYDIQELVQGGHLEASSAAMATNGATIELVIEKYAGLSVARTLEQRLLLRATVSRSMVALSTRQASNWRF